MVIGGISKDVFVGGVRRKLRNKGEKEQKEGIDNRQEVGVQIEDMVDSLLKVQFSNEESHNKENEINSKIDDDSDMETNIINGNKKKEG